MKAQKTLEEKVKMDMASHGMKVPEFTILEALYHKGKQTVREVSQTVLINVGSITYVMDKLVEQGLIERTSCADDRRVVYIDITDSGRSLMDEIFPQHQQVIEEMFAGLSNPDKAHLIDMLKAIGKGEN
jgi:MarR family 2-MHQ and catechol resistance regulon transcriptional repressor